MVKLTAGFGTATQQERDIVLRLSGERVDPGKLRSQPSDHTQVRRASASSRPGSAQCPITARSFAGPRPSDRPAAPRARREG
ncbi:MAG: hypothetical protein ACK58U_03955 [Rubrivivax sp.]